MPTSVLASPRFTTPPSMYMLLLVAVGIALTHLWAIGRNGFGLDFYNYWAVPQAVTTFHSTAIYSSEVRNRVGHIFWKQGHQPEAPLRLKYVTDRLPQLESTGTPLFYVVTLLTSISGNYDIDLTIFQVFSMVCLVGSVLYLSRLTGMGLPGGLLFLAIIGIGFEPLFSEWRVANVNQILLAMVTFYLYTQQSASSPNRHRVAGFLLAMTLLFKPLVIYVVALQGVSLLFGRRWQELWEELKGGVLALVTTLLITWIFFDGPGCWDQWLQQLTNQLPDAKIPTAAGNYSISLYLTAISGIGLFLPLSLGLFLLIAFMVAKTARDKANALSWATTPANRRAFVDDDLHTVALGLLVYLLSSRLVWLHYYVLTIPALLICLSRPIYGDRMFDKYIGKGLQVLAVAAFILISAKPVADLFGYNKHLEWAVTVNSGLILLCLLTVADLIFHRSLAVDLLTHRRGQELLS